MSTSEKRASDRGESRRPVIIVVAVLSAIVIAVFFFLLMRATGGTGTEPRLEGGLRAGSPEFEPYRSRIVLDSPEADEAKRALGDIVMSLHTTARNFTGRTINGLEVTAAVVDHQDKPIKSRTVLVIPGKQAELEPNKTIFVQIMLEGFRDTDDRANIKMEVSGLKFK